MARIAARSVEGWTLADQEARLVQRNPVNPAMWTYMDQDTDRQPREWPEDEARSLTPRELETTGQLRLMDPQLADLYEHGLRLLRQKSRLGDICLLAHCGRELSRGVLRLLLDDEELEVFSQKLYQEHRPRIARALGLPDSDPRVDGWFKLHSVFASAAHWRPGGPSGEAVDAVRDAFERFSSLLYGRVAPYFSTESELDSLLAVDLPTAAHTRQLRHLQLRLAQRNYFFGRLKNPAWVEHLADSGFFSSPPVRKVNPDQSWRARAWPEGDYLVEVAAGATAAVASILETVPLSNDNPLVWDIVARAAQRLPPDLAVRMVPSLANALKTLPTELFSASVVDLAVALAEAERHEAYDLVNHLFYVVGARDMHQREGLRYTPRTDWILPRLGDHRYDELCSRIVTALETLDSERTLRLLLKKIQRVQRLADDLDFRAWWHLERLDVEGRPASRNVVSALVASVVGLAHRITQGRPHAAEAERAMEVIDSYHGEFFSRIRHLVLARVGNHLQERVDQVLQSEEARSPGYHAPELAVLLRAQFRNASDGARKDYAAAIKAASDPHRQRRILTFFRGDIPEEFEDLARELEVLGVEPSYQEQQMAEVGIYSDGVGSRGGYESPVSVEQLSTWTPDDVVAFLRDCRPSERGESAFGLRNSLAAYAKENTPAALSVLNCAVKEGASPSAIEGILEGVGEAAKAGTHLDWRQALSGVGEVMRHVATLDLARTESIRQWRRTAGRAMWFIEEGCRKDSIPSAQTSEVWALLDMATTIPAIWQVGGPQNGSLEAVIMASLNDASGNVANAVRSVALWDYRCRTRGPDNSDEDTARARDTVQQSLLPILDRWLKDEGPNAAIPRALMGDYLPQLHLLAPEWIEAHASDLFQGGLEDPARRPTWTTYVSRAHLYDTVYCALRVWYARAAEEAAVWASATGDAKATLEPTERLAVHLVGAFLRDLVSVGDEDGLLETAYANLSPTDWGRAYWAVFRGWTDAAQPVPRSWVRRLIDLWEWRILEMEKSKESDRTVEEAKALWWLFQTPYIAAADLIRLGRATVRLARGRVEIYSEWEQMLALAQSDADGAFDIAKTVLRAQPYVAVEYVKPFLAHVLMAGSPETRAHARSLINQLGERGYRALKDLLQE